MTEYEQEVIFFFYREISDDRIAGLAVLANGIRKTVVGQDPETVLASFLLELMYHTMVFFRSIGSTGGDAYPAHSCVCVAN